MVYVALFGYFITLYILAQINSYIALAFIFITTVILKAYFPQIKGYIGENRIRRKIEQLGEEYKVFNDFYVEKENGELTQIDHVVTSPFGIFVIETKNYDGWIFGSEKQRYWTQTIYKKKSKFLNPIIQNYAHVKALQHLLQTELPIYSIVVFSNAATFKFKEPFEQATVIQNDALTKTVKAYSQRVISEPTLASINATLQNIVHIPKQQKAELKSMHLQQLETKGKVAQKKVVPVKEQLVPTTGAIEVQTITSTCPRCGNTLQERKGKYGAFIGCSNFPKCRYTVKN